MVHIRISPHHLFSEVNAVEVIDPIVREGVGAPQGLFITDVGLATSRHTDGEHGGEQSLPRSLHEAGGQRAPAACRGYPR